MVIDSDDRRFDDEEMQFSLEVDELKLHRKKRRIKIRHKQVNMPLNSIDEKFH